MFTTCPQSRHDVGGVIGFNDPDFFDHAPIGIFTSTPEGKYLSVNTALARMFGYKSPQEFLEAVQDIPGQVYVDPTDREEFKRLLEEHGQVWNHQGRRLHRDGSVFWVSVNARVVRDQNGEIACYQGFTTDITEAKLDHEKLLESEDRNKALLNALPDFMFLFSRSGVFLDYHAPCGALLMEPDMFLGRNVRDVLGPDIAEQSLRHIDRVAETGACVSYGYELVFNGETKCYESRMTGCGEHFLAIVRDVTDLRRSQEALKEQTRLLGKITDNMLDMVTLTDLEGKILFLSRSGSLLGHDVDSRLGRNIMEFVHPEDKPKIMAAFEDFLAVKDGARKAELRCSRADGSYLWLETVGGFIFDDQGNPKELLFSSRDVTERKKAEAALQKSNADLKAAERLARMGSWKYDPVRDVFTGSEEAFSIIGMEGEGELLFDDVLWIIHEDDREFTVMTRDKLLRSPQAFDFELRVVVRGQRKWVRVLGDVKVDNGDKAVTIIGMLQDITEKRQLEIAKKEQEEQLAQASKMTALGTLVAGVAHEINNPNNLIMLNAPLLERAWRDVSSILEEYWRTNPDLKLAGIPFGEMREHALELYSGINEGSRRIAKIINELKDFCRQTPLDMAAQVNINEVVESALVLIGKAVSRYTDNFSVTLSSDLPLIQGDHHKLEQVVVNLLLNACQALTDKQQSIVLETHHVPERKAVAVRITDQGEGIRPEDMNRVLDPFYSTRHKTGGTGLGLSISSAIIQDHGGDIHFESSPGQGTMVTVLLSVPE
ncbi:PAS domain-containing sensor histidine kinase [Desulfonatronum lacustre]|uniref:PAS domain-containing sensor histidine kinase n=1 Tax=Desulfonatronum lacustre TaxID=66849 RepID=UPI0004B9ED25|nr:PAS domain S-box protein [Desulfonatronum lacustre]